VAWRPTGGARGRGKGGPHEPVSCKHTKIRDLSLLHAVTRKRGEGRKEASGRRTACCCRCCQELPTPLTRTPCYYCRFPLLFPAAAMLRVAGTLSKSTEVMKAVNTMIKAPELQRTMMEMSKGGCVHHLPARPVLSGGEIRRGGGHFSDVPY
jgi:hypothetical protein